jgi:serine/threonine protein kinase
LETAVALLRQLCDALEYAHRFLVHRDLSPENLMVLPNGDVKLLDFGLARTAGQATVTATGVTLGKAHYMSPEQRKDAARVDARTDLYALGVMFFEMLTGQLPLGVKTAVDLNPELPVGCDVLIGHCLAPLEDRIKTVGEFRVGLNKCIEEALPTEPGGERASEKGEPVPGRRTWAFRSGVVLSGAALCLAAWFMGSRIRESMRPPEPPRVETSNAAQQERSTTPPDTAPAPEPEPEPAAAPKPESEEQAGPEAPNSSTPDAKSEPKPADPAKAIESLEGISMLRGDWMGWEGSTPKDPKQDKPQCAASFAGNRFTILKANERLLLGNKTQWDLEGTFTTDISAKPYKILLEGKQSLENSLKSPFACDGIFEVDKDQLRLSLGSPGEHRVLQFGGNWKDLVLNRIR